MKKPKSKREKKDRSGLYPQQICEPPNTIDDVPISGSSGNHWPHCRSPSRDRLDGHSFSLDRLLSKSSIPSRLGKRAVYPVYWSHNGEGAHGAGGRLPYTATRVGKGTTLKTIDERDGIAMEITSFIRPINQVTHKDASGVPVRVGAAIFNDGGGDGVAQGHGWGSWRRSAVSDGGWRLVVVEKNAEKPTSESNIWGKVVLYRDLRGGILAVRHCFRKYRIEPYFKELKVHN